MFGFSKVLRTTLATLTLVSGLASTGCGARITMLRTARTTMVATPQSPDLMRAAIARALSTQQFTTDLEQDGTVVAQYVRGQQQLRVRITYSPSQFDVTYLESSGFNAQLGTDGNLWIHPRYERIVNDLTQAINLEIDRPQAEAQAMIAAQQQQAYQLEQQRLQLATAQANANRPVIIQQHSPVVATTTVQPVTTGVTIGAQIPGVHGTITVGGEIGVGVTTVQHAPVAVVQAQPVATCRSALVEHGHPSSALMFCDGVEQRCAVALLRAGHNPTALIHCQNVQAGCAETLLRRGDDPTELIHCQ